MNSKLYLKQFVFLTCMLMFGSLFQSQQSVQSMDTLEETAVASISGPTAYIVYAPGTKTTDYVAPPLNFQRAAAATANIQVNYNGGGWTTAAQNAFEYAVSIWETQIASDVTIVVDADFSNLGACVLGGAGAENLYRDFSGAPMSNTWYPVATANALAGTDLDPGDADIGASFNNNINCGVGDWYFGIDGNTPSNDIDFVSVVLHEIGHGLGFFGSMAISNGLGGWGYNTGYPTIYDRYTENASGQSLISSYVNPSAALATQLTSNNIYFDAPNATTVNGGRVPLYAPSSWQQGSSYSHLAESFNGTPNALMTYALDSGEAQHNPGPVVLAMFRDLGWLAPPTVSNLPEVNLSAGQTFDNVIDLWAYTTDDVDEDSDLNFQIESQSDPTANVTIDNNRYVDINPTNPSWEGTSAVTIQVTDTDGLSTDAVFFINSEQVFLPLVVK